MRPLTMRGFLLAVDLALLVLVDLAFLGIEELEINCARPKFSNRNRGLAKDMWSVAKLHFN